MKPSRALAHVVQLYRDRCDCENGFDELKNQWGWGGFNTQARREALTSIVGQFSMPTPPPALAATG